MTYKQHPIVERYFPLLPRHLLEEMAGNLQEVGQQFPVILYKDGGDLKILDGNNRYHAMRLLNWKHQQMTFTEFKGTPKEALKKVFALNYHRRHMSSTERQTAMMLFLTQRNQWQRLAGRPKTARLRPKLILQKSRWSQPKHDPTAVKAGAGNCVK